jgi:hypothetical protein
LSLYSYDRKVNRALRCDGHASTVFFMAATPMSGHGADRPDELIRKDIDYLNEAGLFSRLLKDWRRRVVVRRPAIDDRIDKPAKVAAMFGTWS